MAECKTKVICVVGPTASGKTALAVRLAHIFGGEVVSCDSMQIYRDMQIATAAPTEEEKEGIPHHLIGFVGPEEAFSVAEYCREAKKVIAEIAGRGNVPIICGGTGLYYSSLIDNIEFFDEPGENACRAELKRRAELEGIGPLYEQLKAVDPEAAASIHPNNEKRVIRALEVYLSTGRTLTQTKALSRQNESGLDPVVIGLDAEDRAYLYNRIDIRVDAMVKAGLIDEAKRFYSRYNAKTAAQAIGYKELMPYLNGEDSLENCIEKLKYATHRYAKRQLTWFRRDERVSFLMIDRYGSPDELAAAAVKIIKEA